MNDKRFIQAVVVDGGRTVLIGADTAEDLSDFMRPKGLRARPDCDGIVLFDGGPAYPSHGTMGEVAHQGMSLRDHFAAEAIHGVCDRLSAPGRHAEIVALDAYAIADAMLAERHRGGA